MWYSVSVAMKASNSKLWEESVYLVKAQNEDDARTKGEECGKKAEHSYASTTGEEVVWKFDRILSVCEILEKTIGEGAEIFWRFLRESEVKSLSTPFEENELDESPLGDK